MADIRKRTGKKGVTYQVRYPSRAAKTGYAFATFATLKEARAFVESGRTRAGEGVTDRSVRTVPQAIERWLQICEKEGTDGNEPVTTYTLKLYKYFAEFMKAYPWDKNLHELQAPDIVQFRSWLLTNCPSRYLARKTLTYFQTVLNEMALRGHVGSNVAAGITVGSTSRYEQPVSPPTVEEFHALLRAADRLANSKNQQIARAWRRNRPMIYLAGDTGMRPGEYFALPRFNVSEAEVKVDRAVERSGHKISVTKTPAGWRWIDLSPETADKGHSAKEIKAKLAALGPGQLPSVDQAKEITRQRAQAKQDVEQEQKREQQQEQEHERDREQERDRVAEFRRQKEQGLAEKQAARRLEVQQAEQQLFTRQQSERLAVHAAQKSESRGFLFRVRSAVAELIRRTPALRSVLAHIQSKTHLDPKERHRLENEALARRHAREKRDIERRRRTLARLETRERQSLEKAVRREQRLQEAARLERERTAEQARTVDNKAMQDFFDAARDQGAWKQTDIEEGELSRTFNDEAGFDEGPRDSGDDDDGLAPDRSTGLDDEGGDDDSGGPRHRQRRGKGYGYRRDSD